MPPGPARIWMYVPEAPLPPSAAFPLLQSYIDVCLIGALEHGPDYAREFVKSTDDWSDFWLNDRLMPRRPWVYQKRHDAIDDVLNSHGPSHTTRRCFPEDYSARYSRA